MLKLHSRTQSNPVGKPSKFVATFKGDIRGITATLKIEAETERDIMFKIPLVPKRELDVEIIDLNSALSDFQEDNVTCSNVTSKSGSVTLTKDHISKLTELEKKLKAQAEEDDSFRALRKKRAEAQA